MHSIAHAAPRAGVQAGRDSRIRPWQRALALTLAALIASSPVAARGPGRAGIADLVEEPDEQPAAVTRNSSNLAGSLDPTMALPGNPTVSGLTVDARGDQP